MRLRGKYLPAPARQLGNRGLRRRLVRPAADDRGAALHEHDQQDERDHERQHSPAAVDALLVFLPRAASPRGLDAGCHRHREPYAFTNLRRSSPKPG